MSIDRILCKNNRCVFFRDKDLDFLGSEYALCRHCNKRGAELDEQGKCLQFIPIIESLEGDHASLNRKRKCWNCGRPGTIIDDSSLEWCPSCKAARK